MNCVLIEPGLLCNRPRMGIWDDYPAMRRPVQRLHTTAFSRTQAGCVARNDNQFVGVQAQGDPARVTVLYERTVAVFPVTTYLWLQYGRYLETHVKLAGVIRSVYSRAVRNCPWVGSLWARWPFSPFPTVSFRFSQCSSIRSMCPHSLAVLSDACLYCPGCSFATGQVQGAAGTGTGRSA
jgi:hypothetical protein